MPTGSKFSYKTKEEEWRTQLLSKKAKDNLRIFIIEVPQFVIKWHQILAVAHSQLSNALFRNRIDVQLISFLPILTIFVQIRLRSGDRNAGQLLGHILQKELHFLVLASAAHFHNHTTGFHGRWVESDRRLTATRLLTRALCVKKWCNGVISKWNR